MKLQNDARKTAKLIEHFEKRRMTETIISRGD